MALEFNLRDYFDPLKIIEYRYQLFKNLNLSSSKLEKQTEQRLSEILDFATREIPHYQAIKLSKAHSPLENLQQFPILTRDQIVRNLPSFYPLNQSGSASTVSTSGSTGQALELLMDRNAKALEFVHYWRHWSWFGYQLGDPFTEFSTMAFLNSDDPKNLTRHSRLTNRLTANTTVLNRERCETILEAMEQHRPKFLKGLASVLNLFATLSPRVLRKPTRLKAAFSTGENLSVSMRRRIEEYFDCPVIDSYGQMERVASIVQCEKSSYHVLTDYGFPEFLPATHEAPFRPETFRLVATGLHNRAMPLVRYDTGDFVIGPSGNELCVCGRPFPTVREIIGRDTSKLLKISNDFWMPASFVLLDGIRGVDAIQVFQLNSGEVVVYVVAGSCGDPDKLVIAQTIKSRFKNYSAVVIKFTESENLIRDPKSGKTPYLISELKGADPQG